jgi:hypothetical protein
MDNEPTVATKDASERKVLLEHEGLQNQEYPRLWNRNRL